MQPSASLRLWDVVSVWLSYGLGLGLIDMLCVWLEGEGCMCERSVGEWDEGVLLLGDDSFHSSGVEAVPETLGACFNVPVPLSWQKRYKQCVAWVAGVCQTAKLLAHIQKIACNLGMEAGTNTIADINTGTLGQL